MKNIGFPATVERWGVFEARLPGKTDGNPFTDYQISGVFNYKDMTVTAAGFYDGDGVYAVRFMPSFEGEYTFRIEGSFGEGTEGRFTVTAPVSANNHGPVRIKGYHFEYEDGVPYYPVGTTAYVWTHQAEETQLETLKSLGEGYFNKIRFCVFPKHYLHNLHEPCSYPYEGTPCRFEAEFSYQTMGPQPGNDWDFSRFNPAHFQQMEKRIVQLSELGIEADIICMHAYDRWGFSEMSAEEDDLYFRYITARFAAYRNVWWSVANEYDLLRKKTVSDWERYAQIILDNDPYGHPRSIHNCGEMYDHSRPWITHCSIQRIDLYKCAELTDEYRIRYQKPVVLDEIAYEGDVEFGWGNISGEELVRRFWESAVRGGYASHGETFDRPEGVLWWSHGGKLHGESPARLRFLLDILKQTPGAGLKSMPGFFDETVATVDDVMPTGYYLYYYGFGRPCRRRYNIPMPGQYDVDIIDTWEMTVTPAGRHSGSFVIELPRKPYIAVRIRPAE